MTLRVAIISRNAELDALAVLADSGLLRIYTGAQPATPEDAATGTLLAEFQMNAPAFAAASGGTITANAISPDTSADDTGEAGWFRLFQSDGTTPIMDGDCSNEGGGGVIEFDSIAFEAGAQVNITSFVITLPM